MSLATSAPLGAVPVEPGRVDLRVWAPSASSVAVRLRGRDHPLAEEGDGSWADVLEAVPGEEYGFGATLMADFANEAVYLNTVELDA